MSDTLQHKLTFRTSCRGSVAVVNIIPLPGERQALQQPNRFNGIQGVYSAKTGITGAAVCLNEDWA